MFPFYLTFEKKLNYKNFDKIKITAAPNELPKLDSNRKKCHYNKDD